MVTRRKQLRYRAVGLALALALAVAGSAVAEPSTWGGGWMTEGFEQLGRWWSGMWQAAPATVRAANETIPPSGEPDGTAPVADDPDSSSLLLDGEGSGETDAAPHIDPNG